MKYSRITYAVFFCLTAAMLFAGGSSDKKNKTAKQSATSKPEWIENPSASYADDSYLTSVGTSASRSNAENDAVAGIGKILNQSIEAEENMQQSFSTTSDEASSYLSNIKTSTSLTDLVGVSIKANWTAEDGTEYALAVLNRTESGQYYRNKIDENNKTVVELLSLAEKNEGAFTSCANAVKAYELAKDNDYYLSLLTIIKPVYSKVISFDYGSSNTVVQKVSDLLSKINILISVDNDTDGRIAAAISSALSSYGIHSFGGTTGTENIQYALMATVTYEPIEMTDSKYSFVRYNIITEMIEKATGKNILSWKKNARVGKLTANEAQQASVRALETAIQTEYPQELSKILK